MIGSAGHAHAQPSPAEIEAEIDKKWNEIEPVIEEHNAVRIKLEAERAKADALAAQLAPLEEEVSKTRERVGVYADYMYKGGRAIGINAFLSTGDPTVIAERLSSMEQVTSHFNARIGEVLAAKAKLDESKRPLDAMIAQLDALEKEQNERIAKIKDEIKKLDQMRLAAYGNGGGEGELRPVPCPVTYPGGAHGTAVKFACDQIGKPYVFAQDGPSSYDCSGLTKAAWLKAGVSLPHNAKAQRAAIPRISRSELMPGDLVFYYSDLHHVAMYAGKYEGVDWIVHASRSGVPLKMRKMDNGYIHSYGRPG
ncbi:NlpC/P60 family protein [Allorhizocola rhizosphaerae]|uniref:C40 family peptidase n=1 Tax=Allorhizocola rhizosphaerae TaxID=1872709 RepID=UPI001FE508FA|nr:C40 family peptidase [Allorhizocola rhizosphaerae]